MGLTHHWKRPVELSAAAFEAAADDVHKVVAAGKVRVAGFDGTGAPTINAERIVFNGRLPQACEPFEVAAVEFDRCGRDEVMAFCKTEKLPYDLLVKAALIVLEHHLRPSFRVTSDADEAAWLDARDLVQCTLGYGNAFTLAHD